MEASLVLAIIALAGSVLTGCFQCLGRIKTTKWCCCVIETREGDGPDGAVGGTINNDLIGIIADLSHDRSNSGSGNKDEKIRKKRKRKSETSPTSRSPRSYNSLSETEQEEKAKSEPLPIIEKTEQEEEVSHVMLDTSFSSTGAFNGYSFAP